MLLLILKYLMSRLVLPQDPLNQFKVAEFEVLEQYTSNPSIHPPISVQSFIGNRLCFSTNYNRKIENHIVEVPDPNLVLVLAAIQRTLQEKNINIRLGIPKDDFVVVPKPLGSSRDPRV